MRSASLPWALIVIAAVFCAASSARADDLENRLEHHVHTLTAPKMEGRGNRTEGLERARDYIADQMREIGLEPAGSSGYLAGLEVVVDTRLARSVELRIGAHVLAPKVDYAPAGFSGGGSFSGEVAFVGYGISAPHLGWDDYLDAEVEGRVVIAVTGVPERLETKLADGPHSHLSTMESKAAVALAHGASAFVLVNNPADHGDASDQHADTLSGAWPAMALEGLPVARMTSAAARSAFAQTDTPWREWVERLGSDPAPMAKTSSTPVRGDLTMVRTRRTVHNVVGRLPSGDPAGDLSPIVVGAHYDGLGRGEAGSFDKRDERVHPGADDNASGVAVLLEAARSLRRRGVESERPVYFAALAAEELGLHGSRALARRLTRRGKSGTMINVDMVGRMDDRTVHIAAPSPAGHLYDVLATSAGRHELTLAREESSSRYSDHRSFGLMGFEAVSLTTGRHADYHSPSDTADKIDPGSMKLVHDFLTDAIRALTRRRQ